MSNKQSEPISVENRGHVSGYIPALDAVRGLAILMVLSKHFSHGAIDSSLLGRIGLKVLDLGYHGVDLFFVLSGFLITGILFDAKNTPHYFRNFYARRTLRIFPLYYGVLFGALIVLPLFTTWARSAYPEAYEHQAWLWLYGTNIFVTLERAWNLDPFNHYWSLAVEEHFYLIWPLILFLCTRRRAMLVCGNCIVIAAVARIVCVLAGNPSVGPEALTLCRIDALAVGGLLALLARGPGGIRAFVPWAIVWAVGSILLTAAVFAYHQRGGVLADEIWSLQWGFWPFLFGGVLVWALVSHPTGWTGRFWNSRVLRFFGDYSYGMYVFGPLLLPVYRKLLPPADLTSWLGSAFLGRLVFVIVSLAATLVVALLSWHLYEKHFLRLKRWFPTVHRTPDLAGRTVPQAPETLA